MFYRTAVLCAVLYFAGGTIGFPQEEPEKNDNTQVITVSATKDDTALAKSGQSITIITREEIAQSGASTVKELLSRTRGIATASTSGYGAQTSVFLHGAHSTQLLVLVDGIPMNDPSSTGRGFDFATMSTLNIERIEILYGAQSVLYGSGAAAGIINIVTAKGGEPHTKVTLEGGTRMTHNESVELNGFNETTGYSISAKRIDTDGNSRARRPAGSSADFDHDGLHQSVVSSRVSVVPVAHTLVDFSIRFEDSTTGVDNGQFKDDSDHIGKTRLFAAGGLFTWDTLPWWTQKLSFTYSSTLRKDIDKIDGAGSFTDSWFDGINRQAELRSILKPVGFSSFIAGIAYTDEEASTFYYSNTWTSHFPDKKAHSISAYLNNTTSIGSYFTLSAGGRVDHHDSFGNAHTYSSSALFTAPGIKTKLRTAVGSSFTAPSLYQRFLSGTENKDLEPEKGRTINAGIEQPFGDFGSVGINAFRNTYRDMIVYYDDPIDYTKSKYVNTGKAKSKGFETIAHLVPLKELIVEGSYTYTVARDCVEDKDLKKRPRHSGMVGITYLPSNRISFHLDGTYTGKRYDVDESTWPMGTVTLDSYAMLNMCVTITFLEKYSCFVKANDFTRNSFLKKHLGDSKFKEKFVDNYFPSYGYNCQGITLLAGVSAQL
jgi:vitamin B12 transporter